MSLLTEISRTVVNARTYTGPGGNIPLSTSPVAQTPSYFQRGALSTVPGSSTLVQLIPSFSYDGSTMVLPNALVSGAAQMLVYTQAADKTYSVSSNLAIADTTLSEYCSSAISYDGTVCVFGNHSDTNANGKVVVFRKVNGVWTRIFAASGTAATGLGYTVSVSGDGTKIAVSAPDFGGGAGYVNVYTRTGSVVVLKQTLTATAAGLNAASFFGYSCSLSGDGTTLAVGAPENDTQTGAVVIYKLINNVWSQQSTLVPVGVTNPTSNPNIGGAVSLDETGSTLVIGCIEAGLQQASGTGCVVVYTYQGGVWTQGQTIIPYDIQTSPSPSNVGYSVSMSADGQTLSFAGLADYANQGGVWIFVRGADETWYANGNKRVGTGYTITTGGVQQYGAVLSPDASVLAVVSSTYNDANNFAFWIFA